MSFSVSNYEFTADLEATHFHCVRYIGPVLDNLEKGGRMFYVFEVTGRKRIVLPLAFTWTGEEAKLIFPLWTRSLLIIPQEENENAKNYSLEINFYKAPENSELYSSTLQFKWFAGLGPSDARNIPYEEILPDLLGEKRPLVDGTVLPLIYGGCRYLLQVQRVRDIEVEVDEGLTTPFDDSVYHFNLQEGNFKFEELIDSISLNSAQKIIKILSGKNGSWSEELKFLNFQLKNDNRIVVDGKEILLLTGIPVVLQEELLNYLKVDFVPFDVCKLIPEEHFQLDDDDEEETEDGEHYNLKNNNENFTFITLLEVENLASPLMSQILVKLSTNKCENRIIFMTAAVSIESCGQLLNLEKSARQHRFQLMTRSFPVPNEIERIKIVESESGDDFDLEGNENEFVMFKWVFSSFSITDLMRLGHIYRELKNFYCDFKSKSRKQILSAALEIIKNNQSATQPTTEFTILSSMPPSKGIFPFYGYQKLQEELGNLLKGPLINSEAYARFGLSMASGFLVHGPTGCGKTSLCLSLLTSSPIKDIFTVIHVPSASQLLSKYFGETEENLRKLFTRARQQRPCIIFIDQIESLGRKRGGNDSEGSSSSARYLSTLLNEMDGISSNEGVTILACALDISMLDEALLRPGRLDRHFFLDYPNELDKIEIVKGYLEDDSDNNIEKLLEFKTKIDKKMISGGQIKSKVMEFNRKK